MNVYTFALSKQTYKSIEENFYNLLDVESYKENPLSKREFSRLNIKHYTALISQLPKLKNPQLQKLKMEVLSKYYTLLNKTF